MEEQVPPNPPESPGPVKPAGGTGLDENIAGALSYFLGLITGIIFLAIEKDNSFVKFHAMQSIIFCIVVVAINIVLPFIPVIGIMIMPLFGLAVFILWLMLMWKAYNKEEWELPYIGKIARDQVAK